MRIIAVVGDHPRNLSVLRAVRDCPGRAVAGVVRVRRAPLIPKAPEGLSADLTRLWNLHFEKRAEAEEKAFGTDHAPGVDAPCRDVKNAEELNNQDTARFIAGLKADAAVISGVPVLKGAVFDALPPYSLNLHMGLIPHFKGSITMFWPFYLLQPRMAGCTWHVIDRAVDTGEIFHQVTPGLAPGMGMHDTACAAFLDAAGAAARVTALTAARLDAGEAPRLDPRLRAQGKLFKKSDWRPEQLRVIYDVYEDRIVDLCLKGEIESPPPALVSLI